MVHKQFYSKSHAASCLVWDLVGSLTHKGEVCLFQTVTLSPETNVGNPNSPQRMPQWRARSGLRVVGIDTMAPILDVAMGWAAHLGLPVSFICMDVMDLGLKPNSFDGFLLEFYGEIPSLDQTLALQRNLANVLKPGGRGFIASLTPWNPCPLN